MRMYALAALAAVMAFGSIAEAQQPVRRVEFRCELEAKEKGGECRVWGEFPVGFEISRNEPNAELRVRCTDGFSLSDRDAHVRFEDEGDPKTIIWGRDDGDSAKLVIVGGLRSTEYEAFLRTSSDGESRKYEGECHLRAVDGDTDDADDDADA